MSVIQNIEYHPLKPFMPKEARVLMLGSFPPPKERWCMDFFYPNPQNDMWRIMGQAFFGDKLHFCTPDKRFKHEDIVAFCEEKGIAIFDTAQAVRRLQGNAADEHLEIVEQTDIKALLAQIPLCHDICCAGGKPQRLWRKLCMLRHQRSANILRLLLLTDLSVSGECLPPPALILCR